MKRSLLPFLIALFHTTLSFTQVEFAPLGATWIYEFCQISGSCGPLEMKILQEDTTINNLNYSILYSSNYTPIYPNETYFIRNENNRVYHLLDSIEYVLYDFNLQAGDSSKIILLDSNYLRIRCEGTLVIDSVRQVEIAGEMYKHFFPRLLYSDAECGTIPNTQLWTIGSYLERIGSDDFFFPQYSDWSSFDDGYATWRCYSDSTLDYRRNINTNCYASGVDIQESIENIQLKVFPNPVVDQLIIDYQEIDPGNFKIYSMSGQLQKTGILQPGSQRIDLSEVQQGMYLLRINSGGKMLTQKIIIQQ